MRLATVAALAAAAMLLAPPPLPRAQLGPDDPQVQAMARTALADPKLVRRWVRIARERPEQAGAPILLLAGQFELGRGRFAAARRFFSQGLAAGADGAWRGLAESGLGWAALGRGDLVAARAHLEASRLDDPATTIAIALLAAASGDASGAAVLAGLGAGDAAGDLGDVARLALGYARLWTADPTGAEAAFADVTTPALVDDASYAVARTRLVRGDDAGANDVLAILAELPPMPTTRRPTEALRELRPSAVFYAGLRRTRGATILSTQDQLRIVLDGDGAALARAALGGAGSTARAGGGPGRTGALAPVTGSREPVRAPDAAGGRREPAPGAWSSRFAAALVVLCLATWRLRRRRSELAVRRP